MRFTVKFTGRGTSLQVCTALALTLTLTLPITFQPMKHERMPPRVKRWSTIDACRCCLRLVAALASSLTPSTHLCRQVLMALMIPLRSNCMMKRDTRAWVRQ